MNPCIEKYNSDITNPNIILFPYVVNKTELVNAINIEKEKAIREGKPIPQPIDYIVAPQCAAMATVALKFQPDKIFNGLITFDKILTNDNAMEILKKYCKYDDIPEYIRNFGDINANCNIYCYIKCENAIEYNIFTLEISRDKLMQLITIYNTIYSDKIINHPDYKRLPNGEMLKLCKKEYPEIYEDMYLYDYMKYNIMCNHKTITVINRQNINDSNSNSQKYIKQVSDSIMNNPEPITFDTTLFYSSVDSQIPMESDDSHTPMDVDNTNKFDLSIFKIKPFEYQKATVKWAIKTAQNVCDKKFYFNTQQEIVYGSIFMHSMFGTFNTYQLRAWIQQNGIMIIDDRGLGKTFEAIMLIRYYQAPSSFITTPSKNDIDPTGINYDPNYQGTTSTIDIDTLCKRKRTRASLVIVPDNVANQWIEETKLYYNDNIHVFSNIGKPKNSTNIIRLCTETTNAERKDFQLIYALFTPEHMKHFNENVNALLEGENAVDMVIITFNMLATLPDILTEYYWWMVIVDEAHEIFTEIKDVNIITPNGNSVSTFDICKYFKGVGVDTTNSKKIKGIKSNFKVLLSGTPFTRADNYAQYVWQLFEGRFLKSSYLNSHILTDHVIKHLARRNTEENASVKLPPIVTIKKWITLTDKEQQIYDAVFANNGDPFSDILRQLCCNPLIYTEIKQFVQGSMNIIELRECYKNHFKSVFDKKMIEFIEKEDEFNMYDSFVKSAVQAMATFYSNYTYPFEKSKFDIIQTKIQHELTNNISSIQSVCEDILKKYPLNLENMMLVIANTYENTDMTYSINTQFKETDRATFNLYDISDKYKIKIIDDIIVNYNIITKNIARHEKFKPSSMGMSHRYPMIHMFEDRYDMFSSYSHNQKSETVHVIMKDAYGIISRILINSIDDEKSKSYYIEYFMTQLNFEDMSNVSTHDIIYLQKIIANKFVSYYNNIVKKFNEFKLEAKKSNGSYAYLEARSSIEALQKKISDNYYMNNCKYSKTDDDCCEICLDSYIDFDINDTNQERPNIKRISLLPCGHYYCAPCYEKWSITNNTCPRCRFIIKDKHNTVKNVSINVIAPIKKDMEILDRYDISHLIDKEGSKTAHIITYLKQHSDEHILVFCIWEKALIRIKNQLESNGIRCLYCVGSPDEKNNIIQEFQHGHTSDCARVMLLSAQNCVSGVTLTRASKIIYVTPFYGTPEFRRQQELQANARVRRIGQTADKIEQIWFLTSNTCEQIIDTANQSNS